MNIKQEYLYNEDKFLPIQLLTSSYGVAEANPSGIFPTSGDGTFITEVRFPHDSSNMVFMLDEGTRDVVKVYASPPGTGNVYLELIEGEAYIAYVVSDDYVDGFINGQYDVSNTGTKLVLEYGNNPPQVINLENDAMVESFGRDTGDTTQWYNYQGSYNSDSLVWESPSTDFSQLEANNYWLILRNEIIVQLDNIFSQNNMTSFNANNKSDPIKMIRVMDGIAEFMRDKKDHYEDLLGDDLDKVQPIWDFLNSNLPGYEFHQLESGERYYWDYNEGLANTVDAMAVFTDYVRWDGFYAQGGDLPGDIPNSRSQQGRYVAATNQGISHGQNLGPNIELDLSGVMDGDRHEGIFQGGKDARFWIRGAWDDSPWQVAVDPRWEFMWGSFQDEWVDWIVANNKRIGDEYGILEHTVGQGDTLTTENRDWWRGMKTYGENLWENVRPYLNELIIENNNLMIAAGDSLWSGYTFLENNLVGYEPLGGEAGNLYKPDWFNITVPWTRLRWVDNLRNYTEVEESGVYDSDWLWLRLAGNVLPAFRENWDQNSTLDLDGENLRIIDNGPLTPEEHILTTSDWYPLVEYINDNIDKIWVPIYETTTGGTIPLDTGTTEGPVSTYPQAQEAILQNIRFVKDLINSVDENMWASMTNSNALILSTILDIKKNFADKPSTHSIMNITNSTVKPENLEVLWKKVGLPAGVGKTPLLTKVSMWSKEWTPLDTTVVDVGNNVMMFDLNGEDFENTGKYVVMIQPTKQTFDITRTVDGDFVVVKDELNDFRTDNAFYGYNAQLYTAEGELQGGQKIIAASKWDSSEQWLKLTPLTNSLDTVQEDMKIELWSNDFIPAIVEVDIVEHNALTLSYAAYAKKEMNTTTGKCVIYDHTGNVYKELSFGKHSNAGTGGAIVEYRTPVDDTDGY